MSRAEEITSEVRRLVMTCRSLEAQLQQSVPKKTHQELVTKMQAVIDSLSADLGRTKKSLEETETLGGRLNALTSQIATQTETIANQNKVIESLSTKFAETSVPIKMYSEATSKAQELEQRIHEMVQKSDYIATQTRVSELESQIASAVPRAQYASLETELSNSVPKTKFEELESRLQHMVPSDQYDAAMARVVELEASLSSLSTQIESAKARISEIEVTLSNSVPKEQFEAIQRTIERMVSKEELSFAQSKVTELEGVISNSVPRVEFEASRQKVVELENAISNSVPRTSFEELEKAFEQTVPRTELETSRQKIAELEDTLSNSVSRVSFIELHGSLEQTKNEFEAARQRIAELETTLSDSVPKARFEEVQAAFSQTIPKSELELANTKIAELQATLANSVPRSDLEELTSKMSLLRELISGADVLTEMQAPVAAPMQTNQPLPASIEVANLGPAVETPVVETPSAEPIVEAISAPTQEPVQEVAQPIVEPVVASPPPVEVQAATPEHSTPVEAQTIIGSSGVSETTVAVTNETPVAIPAAETHVAVTASTETNQPAEIREVQSQLSEIKGVQESGQSVISESPVTVDSERGFRFSSTEFCAKSGLEFLEDVEKVDLQILEQHFRSGDFERWFKDVLADESSAESLRTIKGKNCSGEELRTQMVAAIAPKYRN